MKHYGTIALLVLLVVGCTDDYKNKSRAEIARDLCEIEMVCAPGLHSSLNACEGEIRKAINDTAAYSDACGEAALDYFGCYSTLSICDGYHSHWDEVPASDYPCRAEKLAQQRACAGINAPPKETNETPDPLASYCALEVKCDPDYYESVRECIDDHEYFAEEARLYSPSCSNAFSDYIACLGQLKSCAELDAYWEELPPYPCIAEEMRLDEECEEI